MRKNALELKPKDIVILPCGLKFENVGDNTLVIEKAIEITYTKKQQ